ncbi:SDR family NAD(P)-dependent oxidoreductase [Zhongshania aquimaris]|uniref:SDR family NAD(P)-dependent oxidoreductase n=1 Tax=Zhongshania aquimaris TaxID=2857107 RepID=A0ABS6VWE2_9GAMM|nr:SDR family NAD(P)-dependent oxidoreductase [Zhongshania aquimaris]MBW2942657.1 SDR family NAD(P)-dependent oxidoreductase [Zhongshania aquimaris]
MTKSRSDALPFDEITADTILQGVDLSGQAAIVTGASSGLGIAIASALAGAGADVTLAVRDIVAGEKVAQSISRSRGVKAPDVAYIDLLNATSIRAFVDNFGDRPLKYLINNAGLMAPPLTYSTDGFESQMAVNYFSPFLLSELLLTNLQAASPARVITVSSGSHHLSELRMDDLHYRRRPYEKFEAYGHAKLCANLLAVEYSRRYAERGVVMHAVTPGGVATNLARHTSFEDALKQGWIKEDGSLPGGPLRSIEQGAASPIWAAVSPELEGRGGLYIEDCAVAPIWNSSIPKCYGVTAKSIDPDDARQLWEMTYPLIERAGRQA